MKDTWTIASWNVNSLKVREEQVINWLEKTKTNIIAIQETKVEDDKFPQNEWDKMGYKAYFTGQKTYNGVALLSNLELNNIAINILPFQDSQARSISAVYKDTLIVNLYVPNGSTTDSDKFQYKLRFLTALEEYLKQQLQEYKNIVVLGDFNIAPADIDIHDPKVWHESTLTTKAVRDKLQNIIDLGFTDSFREHNSDDQEFSWWDYRQASFRRNMGLRIDLILVSDSLMPKCNNTFIDKEPRKNERPSDHTPVIAEFMAN